MRWPPNKAWTRTSTEKGYRHFAAINYGGKGQERWISLVSIIDGDFRLKVKLADITDSDKWVCGWLQLPPEEEICSPFESDLDNGNQRNETCLHPSIDSGLIIPTKDIEIRAWFDGDN